MVGERVAGRSRLERELGRGGMATVYLAVDERLGRPVAVKLLHPTLAQSARARFRREAELAASLKHPNILEVHDFGDEEGPRGPYLACELVDRDNLRQLAERSS